MSIELMAAAWRLPIPATEKMVLLCLCDYANGDGTCWPGAGSMASRCSLTERTIRKAIKWLIDHGWVASDPRPGRTAIYHIDPGSKFTPEANSPRNMTPKPRKQIPVTPEAGSDEPSRTIIEPSVEGKRARERRTAIIIPGWVPIEPWNRWIAMRKEIKAKLSPEALGLAVSKLEQLRTAGNDPGEVLDQSTLNNWKGLFEVKANGRSKQNVPGSNGQGPDKRSSLARAIDEGIEWLGQ